MTREEWILCLNSYSLSYECLGDKLLVYSEHIRKIEDDYTRQMFIRLASKSLDARWGVEGLIIHT